MEIGYWEEDRLRRRAWLKSGRVDRWMEGRVNPCPHLCRLVVSFVERANREEGTTKYAKEREREREEWPQKGARKRKEEGSRLLGKRAACGGVLGLFTRNPFSHATPEALRRRVARSRNPKRQRLGQGLRHAVRDAGGEVIGDWLLGREAAGVMPSLSRHLQLIEDSGDPSTASRPATRSGLRSG